jgi:hypothetical protein
MIACMQLHERNVMYRECTERTWAGSARLLLQQYSPATATEHPALSHQQAVLIARSVFYLLMTP